MIVHQAGIHLKIWKLLTQLRSPITTTMRLHTLWIYQTPSVSMVFCRQQPIQTSPRPQFFEHILQERRISDWTPASNRRNLLTRLLIRKFKCYEISQAQINILIKKHSNKRNYSCEKRICQNIFASKWNCSKSEISCEILKST